MLQMIWFYTPSTWEAVRSKYRQWKYQILLILKFQNSLCCQPSYRDQERQWYQQQTKPMIGLYYILLHMLSYVILSNGIARKKFVLCRNKWDRKVWWRRRILESKKSCSLNLFYLTHICWMTCSFVMAPEGMGRLGSLMASISLSSQSFKVCV